VLEDKHFHDALESKYDDADNLLVTSLLARAFDLFTFLSCLIYYIGSPSTKTCSAWFVHNHLPLFERSLVGGV
jgi:hypothetical protein